MDISIKFAGDLRFIATVDGKHSFVIDGNRITNASAMDFLLAGLGACTSIDVVMILQKMREPLRDLVVDVHGERAHEHPRVYTDVKLHYRAFGNINEEKLVKAIELSQNRYCSASIMFKRSGANVTYSYEIIRDQPPENLGNNNISSQS
ncbi:MAG: OsmC family protein [Thermoplasmata archaeon]